MALNRASNGASVVGMIRRAVIGARPPTLSRDGSVAQPVSLTGSWRRRSDKSADSVDSYQPPRPQAEGAAEEIAQQIEAWTNEGGKAAPSCEPLQSLKMPPR